MTRARVQAMRILLLGGNGQVGREIQAAAGTCAVHAPGRDQVDLTDPAALAGLVRSTPCDVVVNAAAYTAVDRAEGERDLAFAVNAAAPGHLARACAEAGVPLIHVSTDYVFDGGKSGAYVEEDPINPLGVYGASKAAGEAAVREALDRHVILRTSWVFSRHGQNFVKTMLRLAQDRPELRVVDDQFGAPTAASDIATAILTVARRATTAPDETAWGTYHYSGAGRTSWCGFARAVMDVRRRVTGRESPVVHPITTADYPTPVRRPANSELDCRRIGSCFGVAPADWRIALEEVVRALA